MVDGRSCLVIYKLSARCTVLFLPQKSCSTVGTVAALMALAEQWHVESYFRRQQVLYSSVQTREKIVVRTFQNTSRQRKREWPEALHLGYLLKTYDWKDRIEFT